jgi:ADP-heptose:LPS heptosyltransferase
MIPIRVRKYLLTYCSAPLNRLRHRGPSDSKSVFIAKFDGLGDFFLLLPLLKHLLDSGFRITVAGKAFQSQVLEHCAMNIATIPFDPASSLSINSALNAVRTISPVVAVNLSMNAWGGILVNQTRAATMVGLLQEREWYVYKGNSLFYDRHVSYDPALHAFEANCRLFMDLLGVGPVDPYLERPLSDNGEIAIHPYGRWRPRQWPYFAEFIESMRSKGYRCAVLGTSAEHESDGLASRISGLSNIRIVTLQSVTQMLDEIECCRAFIGNDSGPAHYAALIGKPTFVLWGPGNFERIRPLGKNVHVFKKKIECRPCRQRGERCARGTNECLRQITVEEVAKDILRLIPPHHRIALNHTIPE